MPRTVSAKFSRILKAPWATSFGAVSFEEPCAHTYVKSQTLGVVRVNSYTGEQFGHGLRHDEGEGGKWWSRSGGEKNVGGVMSLIYHCE